MPVSIGGFGRMALWKDERKDRKRGSLGSLGQRHLMAVLVQWYSGACRSEKLVHARQMQIRQKRMCSELSAEPQEL